MPNAQRLKTLPVLPPSLAELYNVEVTFDPKPIPGDWNGAGGHCNYSNNDTRKAGACVRALSPRCAAWLGTGGLCCVATPAGHSGVLGGGSRAAAGAVQRQSRLYLCLRSRPAGQLSAPFFGPAKLARADADVQQASPLPWRRGPHLTLPAKRALAPRAAETGWDAIQKQIAKLEKRHAVHIAAYGEGNERRLTGAHAGRGGGARQTCAGGATCLGSGAGACSMWRQQVAAASTPH